MTSLFRPTARRAAESSPSAVPMEQPSTTASTATRIELPAADHELRHQSRPSWSVPSQCSALGPANLPVTFSTA